jgi:uncharacterized SAM-dependent methyltransferase
MKNLKPEASMKIDKKILDDYFAFFTTEEGADILPYFYIENSHLFDELVKNSEKYYVFRDEVELIKNKKDILSNYLSDVSNIVEIGPGSFHSIENKTLPMLSYAKNLKNYYAVDFCEKYLKDACDFIKSNTQGFEISAIKADVIECSLEKFSCVDDQKKLFLLMGSTLCGFDDHEKNVFFHKILNAMNGEDLFFITIDSNNDKRSLLEAYSSKYDYDLCFACLKYFATISQNFEQYLSFFDIIVSWNEELRFVETYFKVRVDMIFDFPSYGKVSLKKGQKLRIASFKNLTIENCCLIFKSY